MGVIQAHSTASAFVQTSSLELCGHAHPATAQTFALFLHLHYPNSAIVQTLLQILVLCKRCHCADSRAAQDTAVIPTLPLCKHRQVQTLLLSKPCQCSNPAPSTGVLQMLPLCKSFWYSKHSRHPNTATVQSPPLCSPWHCVLCDVQTLLRVPPFFEHCHVLLQKKCDLFANYRTQEPTYLSRLYCCHC